MEAAAFSQSLPTDAITVSIEVDPGMEEVIAWEIYELVVPPVNRLTYEEFDSVLANDQSECQIDMPSKPNLLEIAHVLPITASTFNQHRSQIDKSTRGRLATC